MRALIPLILIAAAIGLFVVYIDPAYHAAQAIAQERSSYQQALNTARELRGQRDQLLAKRNTFSSDDVARLSRMLPDTVDNIRLIIDINNIAARHGLSLKNVQLGEVGNGTAAANPTAVGGGSDPVGSVSLGFTVSAQYGDFRAFLADLEHSLRLINIEKLSFKQDEPGAADYEFSIRTYWLH